MKFRGLDAAGDWLIGQGLGSYAQAQAAIALDIAARLRSWRGNCFFAINDGVDYSNLLEKGQQPNLQRALSNCILQTPGVVKIVAISFNFNPQTRALSVGPATVQTVFGQLLLAQLDSILGGPAGA